MCIITIFKDGAMFLFLPGVEEGTFYPIVITLGVNLEKPYLFLRSDGLRIGYEPSNWYFDCIEIL